MVNIDEVRSLCYALAAKQATAFPSPREFNLYANLANMDLFNYYNDIRRKELLNVRMGVIITAPNALNPFLVLNQSLPVTNINGTAALTLPSGLSDLLSVSTVDGLTNVRIVDYERLSNTLSSSIDGPSISQPAVYRSGTNLIVYPPTLSALLISYLSYPAAVKWAYTLTGNTPVYNTSQSANFQWGDAEKINLTMRILKYMGISIREPELTNFATQQEQLAN